MLACMLLAIGGLRVAVAVASGEPFDAEATLAALMVALGLGLLFGR